MDDFDSDEDDYLSEDENTAGGSPTNDNRGEDDEIQVDQIFNPYMEFANILR